MFLIPSLLGGSRLLLYFELVKNFMFEGNNLQTFCILNKNEKHLNQFSPFPNAVLNNMQYLGQH